jgi:hypothetical protein
VSCCSHAVTMVRALLNVIERSLLFWWSACWWWRWRVAVPMLWSRCSGVVQAVQVIGVVLVGGVVLVLGVVLVVKVVGVKVATRRSR